MEPSHNRNRIPKVEVVYVNVFPQLLVCVTVPAIVPKGL
jgi:hypothetical protein